MSERRRIDSVDLIRGAVMVIMLLDHCRDLIHEGALYWDPTDLSKTTPVLFLTRWVTHFCAPVFVFLAGTAVFFQAERGKSRRELSWFLFTRGIWLVFLELTLVRLGSLWNYDLRFIGPLQVIWVIGWSMVIFAAIVRLPFWAILAFGVVLIAGHDAFASITVPGWRGPGSPTPGLGEAAWVVLHQGGPLALGNSGRVAMVIYPLIPWPGVMAAGYALGALYRLEPAERQRWLVRIGAALTLGFVLLRASNLYGDPAPWSVQPQPLFTLLSFLNTSKYPPSLLYLAMTLGPAILALGWLERSRSTGPVARSLVTFGRVPLFYYLLQWPTAHAMGLAITWLAGRSVAPYFMGPELFIHPPVGMGFPLWVVYAGWAVGIALLYPLCRWFAGVKRRRRDWWLGYL